MTQTKINQRYQTALLFKESLITGREAAQSLAMSERQFMRIMKKLKGNNWDMSCLKYESHPAWNRTAKEIEEQILEIAALYPEALNSHLEWLIYDLKGLEIKSWNIKNILIRHSRYLPFKEKKLRGYKKFQASHFGALIQLDTTNGYWLKGYPMIHLILAIDDATRTVVAGKFYEHDSTLNNLEILKTMVFNYGIPALVYTDCDSKFRVIRHGKSRHQNYQKETLSGEAVTEVRRALTDIGSGLITSRPFHPQGKGKVEKIFQFIQNCFIKHHTACNLNELNDQFDRWLSWYDKRDHRTLGKAPALVRKELITLKKNVFRFTQDSLDLDSIFAVKDSRKPNKYNIFSYHGKSYQLPLEKAVYPGKVELRILPDERIRVFQEKKLIAELKC